MIEPAKIQVRFSDLDVLGHVNNNIYLSYFEMARVHYFKELLGTDWNWKQAGFVLAKNEIEYVRSVLLSDEPSIEIYVEQIGTKSFTLGYELKVKGVIYTKGKSVQVCFDSTTQQSILIPEKMRSALTQIIRE